MHRFATATALLLALTVIAPVAYAADMLPDDTVNLSLSTEGFVVTKTADVQVSISAAASDDKSSELRGEMQKAVEGLATPDKGEVWRLTSFNRSQDQTGLTRWDALYEARLPESTLGGLSDRAKKISKPGMQLTISNIAFTPTLAETETRRGELRADIYRRATDELARLNAALPGRAYRIGMVNFGAEVMATQAMPPQPRMMKAMAAPMMDAASSGGAAGAEVAEHLTVTAQVIFAARPPVPAAAPVAAPAAAAH